MRGARAGAELRDERAFKRVYVSGTISFGALVAGLSTGAGFGYIVLLGEKQGRRRAAPVILATFVLAAVGGTVTQLLFG